MTRLYLLLTLALLSGSPVLPASNHWSVEGANVARSGDFNCLFDAVASQFTPDERTALGVNSGEDFRDVVADTLLRNPQMANQLAARESMLRHTQPEALLEGGCWQMEQHEISTDPHNFVNRALLSGSNPTYKGLEQQQKAALTNNDTETRKEISKQMQAMEKEAFAETKAKEKQWSKAAAHLGAVYFTGRVTGGAAPLVYLGARAALSLGEMALDPEVQNRIGEGDYIGAAGQGSYSLPFYGSARSGVENFQQGNYGSSLLNAGGFALDVFGARGRWGANYLRQVEVDLKRNQSIPLVHRIFLRIQRHFKGFL